MTHSKKKNNSKSSKNKSRGNAYERKAAKMLSNWMFDDPVLLRRSADSGAQKCNYSGDIVPEGQLPEHWHNHFAFHIETKFGYPNHEPTFWKYEQMSKWILKSYKESQIHNQQIIWLITQFPHKQALLSTNYMIYYVPWKTCWPVYPTGVTTEPMYVYTYLLKDIMHYQFEALFNIKELTNGI